MLLKKWLTRSKRFQIAHRISAKSHSKFHLILGIPATILASIAGVLFSMETPPEFLNNEAGTLFSFVLAISVPVFTALQTFLRLETKAMNHQETDSAYGEISEEIEQYLFETAAGNELSNEKLSELRTRMQDIRKNSPRVSERHWDKARTIIARSEQNQSG